MNTSSNTVLITGGTSGIGSALAERFLSSGNKVIICGRNMERLNNIKKKLTNINIVQCDVSSENERLLLYNEVVNEFPDINILINNAGIQQRIDLTKSPEWKNLKQEVEINLLAQIHLTTLFIPHLLNAASPYIMNVTSGLAFAPLAAVPVYCSTKAAFHSFTLSLRHQLAETPIKVVEIIPPAVQTDLGGKGIHDFGVPLKDFADAVMSEIEKDKLEITYGFSANSSKASRTELDELFKKMNSK